jgi:DNA-binding NarL/FixJ family response regulator
MSMYVLSESQFDQISKALEAARFALETSQHVQLDLTKPKQTIPLPAGEKIVRATSVQKVKSQSKTRKSSRKGQRGVAVLTEAKVLEIKRQLAAGGKSVAKIAREFGVHSTTINCIKWNKTWKHVQVQQPAPVVVAD